MKIRPLIRGLLTFVPGSQYVLPKPKTGGTDSARYCYGVWMKHLTLLRKHGMESMPNTVAELGPGDSLGIGLAAMLSGANQYYALDVVSFSNIESNLAIFDELVTLFRMRAARPTAGWPNYDSYLDSRLFPSHILTENVLKDTLCRERVESIRHALVNPGTAVSGIEIDYLVPWSKNSILRPESIDLVLSHSVLEHVVDLDLTYEALNRWLRPDAMMSHQIDFTSHGVSRKWNGYRTYSELAWKVIVGNRPFLINRAPYSDHRGLMEANGFELLCELKKYRDDGIERRELSPRWKDITDDDLSCAGAFVQAKKRQ